MDEYHTLFQDAKKKVSVYATFMGLINLSDLRQNEMVGNFAFAAHSP